MTYLTEQNEVVPGENKITEIRKYFERDAAPLKDNEFKKADLSK